MKHHDPFVPLSTKLVYFGAGMLLVSIAWVATGTSRLTDGSASIARSISSAAAAVKPTRSRPCGDALPDKTAAAQQCSWETPRILDPVGNPLWESFVTYESGPLVDKWHQYFDVYHRYFQKFRDKPLNFLEIGVQSGGSIKLWQSYFGDRLNFTGIDVNPYCRELFSSPPNVTIYTGDQASREFWARMREWGMQFDVILDDGGHSMDMQITTFEEAWPMLKGGGIYLCEDMSTSMDLERPSSAKGSTAQFGGGYRKSGTWAEYSKQFVDIVNGHYIARDDHPDFDPLKRQTELLSAAFYDQMVVLEKGHHPAATWSHHGNFQIPYESDATAGVEPSQLDQYKQALAAALG